MRECVRAFVRAFVRSFVFFLFNVKPCAVGRMERWDAFGMYCPGALTESRDVLLWPDLAENDRP